MISRVIIYNVWMGGTCRRFRVVRKAYKLRAVNVQKMNQNLIKFACVYEMFRLFLGKSAVYLQTRFN